MFVEVGDQVRVEGSDPGRDRPKSGNDASIVLAEALGGDGGGVLAPHDRSGAEGDRHVETPNFMNSTGWPDPDHYSTARDLATLAERLMEEFPQYYHYYSQLEFTYNDIRQGNRNPLLYRNMGADGLKTGHTEEAGYGLTASAERDGQRLILVVGGLDSAQARADEAARLLEWGFFVNSRRSSCSRPVRPWRRRGPGWATSGRRSAGPAGGPGGHGGAGTEQDVALILRVEEAVAGADRGRRAGGRPW